MNLISVFLCTIILASEGFPRGLYSPVHLKLMTKRSNTTNTTNTTKYNKIQQN